MSLWRLSAVLAALPLLAAAAAAQSIETVAPLGGTVTGEVPEGGRPTAIAVLVPKGTLKGSLQVKPGKGTGLLPSIVLVAPDGTTQDENALAAAGALLKATSKGLTVTNLPEFPASGMYRLLVSGREGDDGIATSGAFTVKVKGKPVTSLKVLDGAIAVSNEKDDYDIHVPSNALLSVTVKPSKTTPFGPSLKILTPHGDEIDYSFWRKTARDDNVIVKSMPLPFFGAYRLRVGTSAGTGSYTLVAKVKGLRAPKPVLGVPTVDTAMTVSVAEPSATFPFEDPDASNAEGHLWVQVGGPSVTLGGRTTATPSLAAPATRNTYAWQYAARNSAGFSLPRLVVVVVDRTPVADAGPGGQVATGAPATLDATDSLDLDSGDSFRFAWTQVSGPAAAIADPFAASTTFTPPSAGTYVFEVTAFDASGVSDVATVVCDAGNSGAAADAGRNVFVRPQDTVFLSGLRSRAAAGGSPSTWAWTADAGNPSPVTLAAASGPVASFTAPKAARRLRFHLQVDGAAATDDVTVVVTTVVPVNGSPTADAGGSQSVAQGAPISLSGASSSDDGAIQDYEWLQISGGGAGIVASGSAATGTAPNADGVLRFLLLCHDGRKYGSPDLATVVVGAPALPVASAGGDVSGSPTAVLTLDSTASQPSPGQSLSSRQWAQVSGTDWYDVTSQPGGFAGTTASPQITVPSDRSSLTSTRSLLFSVTVTDPNGTSAPDYVTVTFTGLPKNAAPTVDASVSAALFRPGSTVALTSVASDRDGDVLAYAWSQVSGTAVSITGSALASASVTTPVASTTIVLRLTVNDGSGEPNGTASDDVTFGVNQAPAVAISSTPSSGPAGTNVTLSGVGTTDPESETLSYAWTEIPPVVGGTVTLSGANTDTATFTQPSFTGSMTDRRRTFRLTVTDSMGASFAVSRTVNFTPNTAPTLNAIQAAGDRKIFYSNSQVAGGLDRTESLSANPTTDSDGDTLTFAWRIVSGPIVNNSLLSATGGTTVTFGAPKPSATQANTGGVYKIGLTASDGVELTAEQTTQVLVTVSFSGDIYPLMQTSCVSGCHDSAAGGGLRLDGGATTARTNLLSTRVIANDYVNSLLYSKLSTGAMPKTGQLWNIANTSDFKLNMVRDWIEPEFNVTPKPGLSSGAENN